MNVPKLWSTSSVGFFGGFVFAAVVLIIAFGCGNTLPKIPTYEEARKQAEKEFSAHVPMETQLPLDGGLGDVQKESGIAPGAPAPSGGVFMTPNRYAIYKSIKVDRDLLAKKYEAEAIAARTKQIILEATTKSLKEATKRDWLDRNGHWVGLVAGFVLGTALTVGLVYALTGGDGVK